MLCGSCPDMNFSEEREIIKENLERQFLSPAFQFPCYKHITSPAPLTSSYP